MRIPNINRRVDKLTNTLIDEPKEHKARFDADSFTEPEKLLFRTIEELQAVHGVHLLPDVLEANKDLIFKAHKILFKYAVETFRFTMHCFLDNPDSQRDKNIFDIFFYSFMVDQKRCLKFIIELYPEGKTSDEAIGTLSFQDINESQTNQVCFKHWDEIPQSIRKLVYATGYVKFQDITGWHLQKK